VNTLSPGFTESFPKLSHNYCRLISVWVFKWLSICNNFYIVYSYTLRHLKTTIQQYSNTNGQSTANCEGQEKL